MGPPKIQKSKEAKAKAAMSSSKGKKKKWSKGKVRDKLVNLALFDKVTFDKFNKEVPGYKIVTASIASERMKVELLLPSKPSDDWPLKVKSKRSSSTPDRLFTPKLMPSPSKLIIICLLI